MNPTSIRAWLPLLALAAAACSAASDTDEPDPEVLVGAPGVTIHQVAIYQGVKRTLMLDGAPQGSNVPLVAGRDALIRVFYSTDGSYDGQEVRSRLTLAGQAAPLEVRGVLGPGTVEEDLNSSVNFTVPGAMIRNPLDYSVALVQDGKSHTENPPARYPQGGGTESVPLEGQQSTLRIILAPFAYHADGSGRVPNTSPEQVERFRQRFLGMYPVSNVEISVREPVPWYDPILPNGDGWMDVGVALYGFRGEDGVSDDIYYYGMFNPADNLMSYCGGSCQLGVTMLNDNPPETGSVALRLALGVGFDFVAPDTAAHEMGHAHGLAHAPCGQVDGADPAYPYAGGVIGVWGYDPLNATLMPPDTTFDLMSYCDGVWISDYHYAKLFLRTSHVNLPSWHQPVDRAWRYQLVTVDGTSRGRLQLESTRQHPLSGSAVMVTVRTAAGQNVVRTGEFFRYDHLPGGWLFVPIDDGPVTRVELTLDGRTIVAER